MKHPTTPKQILTQLVRHLLGGRANESDAVWLMATLAADPGLTAFFRAEVLAQLDRKSLRDGAVDPVKRRKIFRALSGMKVMAGDSREEFEAINKQTDEESKVARAASGSATKSQTRVPFHAQSVS